MRTVVGIIGGSGFYEIPTFEQLESIELETPFGKPSDVFHRARLGDTDFVFVSRHGRGHRLLPSEVNYRANIYGMKLLGVERLLSVTAVGSMREEIAPGDFCVPDQFIDRTVARHPTFFGRGIVAHVSLADPVCAELSREVAEAVRAAGGRVHCGGTYLCIEGPQFSTRAESLLYRQFQVQVIGMTAMQEARLAREAEMCYGVLAMATDYDCWHEEHKNVEIGDVLRILKRSVETAKTAVVNLARTMADKPRTCGCAHALKDAIITERASIPARVVEDLWPLVGKYLAQ